MKGFYAICTAFLLYSASALAIANPKGEVINQIDNNGLRQGYWIIYGNMVSEDGYHPDDTVEAGKYSDNLREGLWKRFYPGGKLKSLITYVDNHPQGPYSLYYQTGKLEEKGSWQDEHNTGDLMRYHPNGALSQQFHFNDHGKREGQQLYFYENGQLRMSVTIQNGKETGTLKRFYANGDLKEKMEFNQGKLIPNSFQHFESKLPEIKLPSDTAKTAPPIARDDKPNLAEFKGNGFNTLYNKNLRISQVGEFKNGQLFNGKYYRYNHNGLTIKIEVYREGKYIGDLPIPADEK